MELSPQASRSFYRHLGAAGLASRTKPEWDEAIVRAVLALLPPSGDVLDVGCGYGRITIPLAERGYRVTGVDISPQLLRVARRDARARGVPSTFTEGSMTALPYPDESFESCICLWSAFNELLDPEEQIQALREMRRVLRTAGIVVIEGPVASPSAASESRIATDLILGRRLRTYIHDETTLLAAAGAAGIAEPRVEIQDWAGRPRQLLLFAR